MRPGSHHRWRLVRSIVLLWNSALWGPWRWFLHRSAGRVAHEVGLQSINPAFATCCTPMCVAECEAVCIRYRVFGYRWTERHYAMEITRYIFIYIYMGSDRGLGRSEHHGLPCLFYSNTYANGKDSFQEMEFVSKLIDSVLVMFAYVRHTMGYHLPSVALGNFKRWASIRSDNFPTMNVMAERVTQLREASQTMTVVPWNNHSKVSMTDRTTLIDNIS